MSSVSASKKVVGTEYSVDLLLFGESSAEEVDWQYGQCIYLRNNDERVLIQEINSFAETSRSDYLLSWNKVQKLPEPAVLFSIMEQGVDIAHCGLKQGLGASLKDLCMLGFSWDKLNAPSEIVSTSWRLGLEACLIRRKLFLNIGGLDSVFQSQSGAGLELGFRSLKLGAIIEHCPDLSNDACLGVVQEPPAHDLYSFVLRHYGPRWAQYVFFRRLLCTIDWLSEWQSWRTAFLACATKPRPWSFGNLVWREKAQFNSQALQDASVSVIIPTLGRYQYISKALDSLLHQTLRPSEVIVVDQNPPQSRHPEIYEKYKGLNLNVIWEDERGQSLARNTGLAAVRGTYVFLFDDDSIADEGLIEQHLRPILAGYVDVSTGVSYPPPPDDYQLPSHFRYPRLSQTLDTGNCLMALQIAHQIGGLDRNYDFGPGADADLGTRLYLAGYRILHNPQAIRIHYKAAVGGLRVHGANKYNTDLGFLSPFPPVTQSYYSLRYMSSSQRREMAWLHFFTSRIPKDFRGTLSSHSLFRIILQIVCGLPLLPVKNFRSVRQAGRLLDNGIKLYEYSKSTDAIHVK